MKSLLGGGEENRAAHLPPPRHATAMDGSWHAATYKNISSGRDRGCDRPRARAQQGASVHSQERAAAVAELSGAAAPRAAAASCVQEGPPLQADAPVHDAPPEAVPGAQQDAALHAKNPWLRARAAAGGLPSGRAPDVPRARDVRQVLCALVRCSPVGHAALGPGFMARHRSRPRGGSDRRVAVVFAGAHLRIAASSLHVLLLGGDRREMLLMLGRRLSGGRSCLNAIATVVAHLRFTVVLLTTVLLYTLVICMVPTFTTERL